MPNKKGTKGTKGTTSTTAGNQDEVEVHLNEKAEAEPETSKAPQHEDMDGDVLDDVSKLTKDQEQTLAEWFEDNPCFWDDEKKNKKTRSQKDKMLGDKAHEFGKSGEDLAVWWNYQTTEFGQLKKRRKKDDMSVNDMSSHEKWVLTNLSFLGSHTVVHTNGMPLDEGSSDRGEDSATSDIEEKSTDEAPAPVNVKKKKVAGTVISATKSPALIRRNNRKRPAALDEAIMTLYKKRVASQNPHHHSLQAAASQRGANNRRKAWTHWMISELEDLPENLWTDYQKRSFSLVMELKEAAKRSEHPCSAPYSRSLLHDDVIPLLQDDVITSQPPRPSSPPDTLQSLTDEQILMDTLISAETLEMAVTGIIPIPAPSISPWSLEVKAGSDSQPQPEQLRSLERKTVSDSQPQPEQPRSLERKTVSDSQLQPEQTRSLEGKAGSDSQLQPEQTRSLECKAGSDSQPQPEQPRSLEGKAGSDSQPQPEQPSSLEGKAGSDSQLQPEQPMSIEGMTGSDSQPQPEQPVKA